MLNRPSELPQTDAQTQNFAKDSPKSKSQHGIYGYPILLDVPVETLTGITSYLSPPSLFSLAKVNRYLNQHVKDDNTWRRAFVQQFLDIGPESNLDDEKTLLLRRSQRSWRQEFITRYVLIRRWERSRNVTTAHVPVHSIISGMRLMPSNALLTSSIAYGIVARSLPLTGKVLPGYLDASGTRVGLGIGNPNAEFTPDVTACALTSDGGTAKIVWGSRAGALVFTNAPRAMETSRRSAADIKKCSVADEHVGMVLDVQWADGWVISGGADGRVKLWDAKTATCPWSSDVIINAFIPDHCVKVAASIQQGYIATVLRSGQIHVWVGFDFSLARPLPRQEIIVQCPIRTSVEGYNPQAAHDVVNLVVDPTSTLPTIMVAYQNDPFFYRIRVDPFAGHAETTPFGDPFFGSASVVVPFFRVESDRQFNFVLAGDLVGCVSLYAWDAAISEINPATQSVYPQRKFEAHRDGSSVTAIAWNGVTLITGSARGTTHVWDALTFAPLRSFATPVPRLRGRAVHPGIDLAERESVKHILVSPEKDVLFVGVGDRVMAWRAGPVPKTSPGGVRGRHSGGALSKRKGINPKYLGQMELHKIIQESKSLLEDEAKYSKRAYGRELEHRAGLENLGLSESEAIEYILMLSRDEANQANLNAVTETSLEVDEGVFEGDFEGDFDIEERSTISGGSSRRPSTSASTSSLVAPPISSSSSSGSSASVSVSSHRSGMTTTKTGRPIPRVAPSSSNEKIRISPPYREEPMEAGREYSSEDAELAERGTRMHIEDHNFPPIGSASVSPSSAPSGSAFGGRSSKAAAATTPPVSASPLPGGSPKSLRSSAWNTPLKAPRPNTGTSPGYAPQNAWAGPSRISPPVRMQQRSNVGLTSSADDMDEDLRFALELSLIEARSRGENV
ncbi:hypothetical protein BDN70DRAFT_838574 [Pholiota conissans]|uniref:F-box domain-containing protein n=1 Tax=Pholiota conissans TaxID=109636 RepID=A0A9P6CYR8_9AGAR|nr:hypothetical protein BDN70DRAFT_838574 [Pholiota conissans]